MSLYGWYRYGSTMTRAKRQSEALKALDALRLAVEPWNTVIQELRADRGILLGSAQYEELNGVEKCEALDKIDSKLRTAYGFIESYENDFTKKLKQLRVRRGSLDAVE